MIPPFHQPLAIEASMENRNKDYDQNRSRINKFDTTCLHLGPQQPTQC